MSQGASRAPVSTHHKGVICENSCPAPGGSRRRRRIDFRPRPRRLLRCRGLRLGRRRRGDPHRRHLQRLRVHRRAPAGVHGRPPEREDRAQQGRDQQRGPRELLPEAGQDRPRRHRSHRGRLAARGHGVRRPAGPRARRPQEPLARLQGRGRHQPGGQARRLRHRHRARGRLLPLRPLRRGGSPHRPGRGRHDAPGRLVDLFRRGRHLRRRDRQGLLRLRRRHLPRSDQPGRGRVREPRQRRDHRHEQPRRQEDLRPGAEGQRHAVGAPRPVVGRLVRGALERRLRHDALPGLDARRHRGQRPRGEGWDIANVFPAAPATGAART